MYPDESYCGSHSKLPLILDNTKIELAKVTAERDKIQSEKEEQVANLNGKLHTMEKSYEAIIHEALDALASKVESARCKWDSESRLIEQKTQQVLLEFGRGLGCRETSGLD